MVTHWLRQRLFLRVVSVHYGQFIFHTLIDSFFALSVWSAEVLFWACIRIAVWALSGVDDKSWIMLQKSTFLNSTLFEIAPASNHCVKTLYRAAWKEVWHPVGEISLHEKLRLHFGCDGNEYQQSRGNGTAAEARTSMLWTFWIVHTRPGVSSSAQSECRYYPG